MNINDMFPSKYIKSDDLAGQRVQVTIMSVTIEEVGDKDHKPVMRFMNKDKGMVLNKTNGLALAAVFGEDTVRWQGQKIELMAMPTMFQGRQVMGLVCLPMIPGQIVPEFGQATAPMKPPQQPQYGPEHAINNPPLTNDQVTQRQYQQPGPHDFAASEVGPATIKGQAQQDLERLVGEIDAAEQLAGIETDEIPF